MNAACYPPSRRRGINTIELVGCLFAVAGGMWIGATYLGVDLRGAAYQALDDTDLLTKVPEEWRPPNPECPGGDCPDPDEATAAEQHRLRGELETLRGEVTQLVNGEYVEQSTATESASLSLADQLARDRTVAYWQSLSDIVVAVSSLQGELTEFSGGGRHAHAVALRRRALEYGKLSVESLDTEGVDPRAVETGWRIGEWFKQGDETLGRSMRDPGPEPTDGRAVSPEEFWARGEAENAKRAEFVRRKVADARDFLTGRYLTEFPPLGV